MIVRGIIITVALVLIYNIIKKKMESTKKPRYDALQFQRAITALKNEIDIETLRTVEKIFRLETAHFTSQAYKNTGASGLEIHSKEYPYGWKVGVEHLKQIFLFPMPENQTGKLKTFIGFYDLKDSIRFVAAYVKKYRAGRWYSTIEADQLQYEASLSGIKNRFV